MIVEWEREELPIAFGWDSPTSLFLLDWAN